MTPIGVSLIATAAITAAGFAACYVLLLRRLRALLADRQLKLADQIGTLDDAIRALETRLAEHQQQNSLLEQQRSVSALQKSIEHESAGPSENLNVEAGEVSPDIEAAIAAAAVATLGPTTIVQSVKATPSPWTQQGRVLVQGGHNLRVQR